MQNKIYTKETFYVHARPVLRVKDGGKQLEWSPTQGATFAIKRGKMGVFYMGVALCGKKDHFNKQVGRSISTARMEKEPFYKGKRLASVISNIKDICGQHGYVVPVKSITYLEDTLNGKTDRG